MLLEGKVIDVLPMSICLQEEQTNNTVTNRHHIEISPTKGDSLCSLQRNIKSNKKVVHIVNR